MPRVYRGISLPEEMINKIKQIIEEYPELGYQSIAEFIKDAIRDKIKEITQGIDQ